MPLVFESPRQVPLGHHIRSTAPDPSEVVEFDKVEAPRFSMKTEHVFIKDAVVFTRMVRSYWTFR